MSNDDAQSVVPTTSEASNQNELLMSPYGATDDVARRIDPKSTLPTHLQNSSFDEDIWRRVTTNPIANPTLRKRSLAEDPEAREIVRQVMAAANEREKEVLLHNQARVFQEVLGRVVQQVWRFMRTPIIEIQGAPTSAEAAIPANDRKSEKPPTLRSKLLAAALTPNYILLAIAAILGIATGVSQAQIQNYKQSIQSYETAAKASKDTEASLASSLDSIKTQRIEFERKLEDKDAELAKAATEFRDTERKLTRAETNLKAANHRVTDLAAELKKYKDQQSDDIKEMQTRLETTQAKLNEESSKLAAAEASLISLSKSNTEKNDLIQDQNRRLRENQQVTDRLREQSAQDALTISRLREDQDLLRFAETFVQQVRSEVNEWSGPDEDDLEEALNRYDSAKKTIRRNR